MSPADKPVRIGMLGCGVVGGSVARLLLADTAELSTRAGVKIELSRIELILRSLQLMRFLSLTIQRLI
jgi:homoserine dehydrogenase